jgi:hypothetical protein
LIDSCCITAVRRLRDEREQLIIPPLKCVHGKLGLQGGIGVLHLGAAESLRMVYALFSAPSAACAVAVALAARGGKRWESVIPLPRRRPRVWLRIRLLPHCCFRTLLLRRLT